MKLKFTWVPFILSFIAIMVFRINQVLSIGNAAVRVQWDNFEMICFIIAVAAFAIIMIISYLSKDAPDVFVINKNLFVCLFSMITAIFVIWNSVNEFQSYLSGENEWIKLFCGMAGIFAGIVFIFVGLSFVKEKNYFEKHKLLILVPTLWALTTLLKIFFKYNSIPTNFLNVSNALASIFLLFFLFSQARLFAGLFNAATFKKLFYFGFSGILFLTISLTNYLLSIMDLGRKLSLANIITIITGLFLIVYVMCIIAAVKVGKNISLRGKVIDEDNKQITDESTGNANSKETIKKEEMSEVDKLIEDIKNETVSEQRNID